MDNSIQITVSHRVPIHTAKWINSEADRLGVSKSEIVRRVLDAAREDPQETPEREASRERDVVTS